MLSIATPPSAPAPPSAPVLLLNTDDATTSTSCTTTLPALHSPAPEEEEEEEVPTSAHLVGRVLVSGSTRKVLKSPSFTRERYSPSVEVKAEVEGG